MSAGEKENAGGLEQHQHCRVPAMFSVVRKKTNARIISIL